MNNDIVVNVTIPKDIAEDIEELYNNKILKDEYLPKIHSYESFILQAIQNEIMDLTEVADDFKE
jgi:hypothetical protein